MKYGNTTDTAQYARPRVGAGDSGVASPDRLIRRTANAGIVNATTERHTAAGQNQPPNNEFDAAESIIDLLLRSIEKATLRRTTQTTRRSVARRRHHPIVPPPSRPTRAGCIRELVAVERRSAACPTKEALGPSRDKERSLGRIDLYRSDADASRRFLSIEGQPHLDFSIIDDVVQDFSPLDNDHLRVRTTLPRRRTRRAQSYRDESLGTSTRLRTGQAGR